MARAIPGAASPGDRCGQHAGPGAGRPPRRRRNLAQARAPGGRDPADKRLSELSWFGWRTQRALADALADGQGWRLDLDELSRLRDHVHEADEQQLTIRMRRVMLEPVIGVGRVGRSVRAPRLPGRTVSSGLAPPPAAEAPPVSGRHPLRLVQQPARGQGRRGGRAVRAVAAVPAAAWHVPRGRWPARSALAPGRAVRQVCASLPQEPGRAGVAGPRRELQRRALAPRPRRSRQRLPTPAPPPPAGRPVPPGVSTTRCRGVTPKLSRTLTSAPASSRAVTTSGLVL